MRIVGFALFAAMLATAPMVQAAKTQASAGSLKAAGRTGHVYGRSDGVYQDATTASPVIVENGQKASWPGVGYRETFAYGDGLGITSLDNGTGGTCAGNTTTVPCLHTFGSGVQLLEFPVVTNTLPADMDAASLDIGGDQVADDGMEIAGGVLGASGRPFVIGDDPAFYFCTTVTIEDVSGTDDFHVGFRRAEPMNAVFDNYLDLASIGCIAADIYIETINDNAATTSTDTTDTCSDTVAVKWCVYVSNAGVVTYTVNGAAPTTTAAFTFDDGDPVIPFIHFLQDTDLTGEVDVSLWEVGYQQ